MIETRKSISMKNMIAICISIQTSFIKRSFLTFLATLATVTLFGATITSTSAGGAWSSTSTWVGGVVPGANDDVVVASGATVTVPSAVSCRTLTLNGNLNLTGTGMTFTITNNSTTSAGLVLNSGGKLLIGSTNTLNFSTTQGTGITNNGGSIVSTGTNGADGGSIVVNTCCGGQFTVSGSASTTVNNLKFASNANFNLSSGGLLVNGKLSVYDNNFSSSGSSLSPVYGSASTLYISWNGQGISSSSPSPLNGNLAKLWSQSSGTIGVTQGYPNNVTILNVGTSNGGVNVPPTVNVGWRPNVAVGLNGTLQIGDATAGGTNTGFVSLDQVTSFSSGGIIVDNGSALVSPPSGTTFIDKGDFILQGSTTGAFYNYGATIDFAGSGTSVAPQIISTTGSSISFPDMIVSNGTYVQLQSPVTISNILTLTSGYVGTSSTNSLSVTNTSTAAISGGSSTAYIDGPVKWTLSSGTANYIFPVGSGTDYLPFTLNKPSSSSVIATVEAFTPGSGGIVDASMSSLSSSEYWSLATSASIPSGSVVSISRPTAIAPLAYIAESKTSSTGTYTSLAGTASTNGVSNSNDIGTGSLFYFTFGAPPIVSTLAVTSVTTTSVTLNGAFNTGSSSKTTSFSFGSTTAYGTTVNTLHNPINSNTSVLDSQYVTGLTANTIYHYIASDGTDSGSDVTFVTAPNPPVVGTGNSPTSTGFTATWSAPASMGSAPYTYTIEVSSDPTFSTGVITKTGISSGSTSYSVSGLSSGTQYYYRVAAVNATASSVWSSTSAPVSTLIVATQAGCISGTGSTTDPGAIAKTLTLPVIDGTVDAVWSTVPANQISNVSVGSGSNQSTWKAMWTADTLYFLVQVQDPTLISQNTSLPNSTTVSGATPGTSSNYYDFDGVEITLDPDYSHGTSYDGLNDVQFRFNLGALQPSGQSCGCATQFTGTMFNNVASRIDFKVVPNGTGYNVEAAIPWGHDASNPGINLISSPSTYGTASINQSIGVEVQVNDATSPSGRTSQYSWYNSSPAPYQDPSQFAKAALYQCAQPPIVILPTVTDISATGATLGATVSSSGDTPLIARGTGYTTSPVKTGTENALPEGGTGISTYSGPARTDLAPQTKYYYLGYATNSNGGTGVSNVDSFYTLSALPTEQPVLSANACTQMTLNWTAITFPPINEATKTGYLLLRAVDPAVPSTAGITTRIATVQSDLSAGTTLVATISDGSTLTYTDASASSGVTYNYMLVPFTWDGVTADSTYNYFITNPSIVSASIGNIAAPVASATQQPTCIVSIGTITIDPWDNTLTYSVDGTNFSAGPDFSGLAPNTYNVVAKSGSCISAAAQVTINGVPPIPAAPVAVSVQPTCSVSTGSISITSVIGLTYSIDSTNYFSFSDPAFSGLTPGTYNLTAKNSFGCISAPLSLTIAAIGPCGKFFIPDLITPNSDGKNDLFEITALPSGSSLKVFNRWGENIYQSNDYDNQWSGNNAADGTYFYDLKLPDGKEYKGWISIVR